MRTFEIFPGVIQRSKSKPGNGYTLKNKTNASQDYIQYHPMILMQHIEVYFIVKKINKIIMTCFIVIKQRLNLFAL